MLPHTVTADTDLVGKELNGYRVMSKLGSGATGVVYRAQHPLQERPVALKVLYENIGSISSLQQRFEREARVLAKLDHPNIVNISDFGVKDGYTYIAMELLVGKTLEQELQEHPIDPELAIEILKRVCEGLSFAHEIQVVHRDLKPANVFLIPKRGGKMDVKLLDFGLAKMLSVEQSEDEVTLTRRGRIVGTPAYMAPEQITGMKLDVRADVYAAGVLLFEMLADRRPFVAEKRADLLRAHVLEAPPRMSDIRTGLVVHPDLEAIVDRTLEKEAVKRFANAGEMLRALEALPNHPVQLDKVIVRTGDRESTTSELIDSGEQRLVQQAALRAFGKKLGDSLPPATGAGVGLLQDKWASIPSSRDDQQKAGPVVFRHPSKAPPKITVNPDYLGAEGYPQEESPSSLRRSPKASLQPIWGLPLEQASLELPKAPIKSRKGSSGLRFWFGIIGLLLIVVLGLLWVLLNQR